MRKLYIKAFALLCAASLTISSAACGGSKPAEPSAGPKPSAAAVKPTDTPAPTNTPQPTNTPAPTETPEPAEQDFGLLELGAYYYRDGDEDTDGIIFYEDGIVRDNDYINSGQQGEFTVKGGVVTVYQDDEEIAGFRIVDKYTIENNDDETRYIRKGGAGFAGGGVTAETPPIFCDTFYYQDGDTDMPSLYFFDDGTMDLDFPENGDEPASTVRCDYSIDGDKITITSGGKENVMLIKDCVTIEDSENGDIFAPEGCLDGVIETSEYYYLDGDENAGSVYFYDDGDVDLEKANGDMTTGAYTVDGSTITVELDGQTAEMEIVNGYILKSDEANLFIRLP